MHTYDSRELNIKLNPKDLKPLYRINPYLAIAALVFDWAVIVGSIYLWSLFPSVWLYVVLVFIIGGRIHALAALTHDALHYRLLKNRKWNDLIVNLFAMFPIFTTVHSFRKIHLPHHRKLNTDEDPDWTAKLGRPRFDFPQSKREFITTLTLYLVFYRGVLDMIWLMKKSMDFDKKVKKAPQKPSEKLLKIGFYAVLFGGLTMMGWWNYFLLLWVIPGLTTFLMFQYFRSIAEHYGGLAYDSLFSSSRTVKASWIECFFLAPHNVNYHLDHHLYPGVPFYNLPKLHDLLMQQSQFKERAHITHGYLTGLLDEIAHAA